MDAVDTHTHIQATLVRQAYEGRVPLHKLACTKAVLLAPRPQRHLSTAEDGGIDCVGTAQRMAASCGHSTEDGSIDCVGTAQRMAASCGYSTEDGSIVWAQRRGWRHRVGTAQRMAASCGHSAENGGIVWAFAPLCWTADEALWLPGGTTTARRVHAHPCMGGCARRGGG